MGQTIQTPEGTRDRLFAECRERRQVQLRLTALFERRGYTEVITPSVEYYDLFLRSGEALPQEAMLKLIDRSGKILVMRPDCTTPIARVAATKLRALPLPQRLYYDETVFRSGQAHRGSSSEIAQCGVELIGAAGERSDLEMIALAVDALKSCSLEHYHVELGHAGFFRSLAASLGAGAEETEQLRALIEGKNFAALNDLLDQYGDQPAARALRRLGRLFGTVEVLEEAEALSGGSEAISYLRRLYAALERAGYAGEIRFDLGMVHQIDYYTGVVFRGYAAGVGEAVLSGGRYDKLVEAFGRSAQATGFAVDVDALARTLPAAEAPQLRTLIHFDPPQLREALAAVDARAGLTCELSPCERLEDTLALAREKGAREVVVLSDGTERRVEV